MTTPTVQKVALVTGASSGIGQAAAVSLHEAGFIAYGVARRTDRMHEMSDRGVRILSMDVTDDESTALGVKQILAEAGRIDVLVNNAGYGVRVLRCRRRRAAGGSAPPVRGESVRCRPADPARPARHARPAQRDHH